MSDELEILTLQEKILRAALAHIPFDGWGLSAWNQGAKDAGVDASTARRLYPGGAVAMLTLHNRFADTRMLAAIDRYLADNRAARIRDIITMAVKLRLQQAAGHREAVRRGVTLLALPTNAIASTKMLYNTVDCIWQAAGDTSTDHNFYTKRALLAGVYSSTLLCWLNDQSEDYVETWAFLDRRIADALRIPRYLQTPGRVFKNLPNPMRLLRSKRRKKALLV